MLGRMEVLVQETLLKRMDIGMEDYYENEKIDSNIA